VVQQYSAETAFASSITTVTGGAGGFRPPFCRELANRDARVAPLNRDERVQAAAQAIDGGTCVVGVAGEMAMQACNNRTQ